MLKNPFTIETGCLTEEMIIDRHEVVDTIVDSLTERHENVLIVGDHGIGKTCVLRKSRDKLSKRFREKILLIQLDMVALSAGDSSFLSAAMNKLVEESWTSVFGRKYSELLKTLDGRTKVKQLAFPQLRHFVDLFRLIRPESTERGSEISSELGGKLGLTATRKEVYKGSYKITQLNPGEFIGLAGEIIEILKKRGVLQIVMFGDEANHVGPIAEVNLFKSNLEAFREKDVRFVFSANRQSVESVPTLRDVFPVCVELKGFETKAVLDDLVAVYSGEVGGRRKFSFSEEAKERLWAVTLGHPREIQRICKRCVDLAERQNSFQVGADMVFDACIDLYDISKSVKVRQ